jgi:pimeloyl-ACP methyl ester carboxylesterase
VSEVLFIPGLDDDSAQYPYFMAAMEQSGLHVVAHDFGWQDQSASLDRLQYNLLETIDSIEDRIIAVGVSAGGAAATWALQQRPEKIQRVINVCGALSLPRESHLNRYLSNRFEQHFDQIVRGIRPDSLTDERVTSVRPIYDGIVRRASVQFGKSTIIEIPTLLHPVAIRYALRRTVPLLL